MGRRWTKVWLAAALMLTSCAAPQAELTSPAAVAGQQPDSGVAAATPTASSGTKTAAAAVANQLSALEHQTGARVGLFAVDTATGRTVAYRADERFAFASTSKVLSAAAVLDLTDDAEMDTAVPVDPEDIVDYSPVTEAYAGAAISLREAAEAALTVSDNTAQNLLLERLGGPEQLQAALRAVGDETTDPARLEPELNDVVPGDPRDTTTARAMTGALRAYLVDGKLLPADRNQLLAWMRASTTGADLVRAGVPGEWDVVDKSGAPANYGGRNDVALVWPPGQPQQSPWVITVFTDRPEAGVDAEAALGLVAEATKVAARELSAAP